MTSQRARGSGGFTLVELLIAIGIIGFITAAVLVAVDPVKRIQESRDARRYSEANSILNAILTKQVDDRALYNGHAAAPVITQTGSNVQVLVSNNSGIVCNAAATRPGCDKPVETGANQNCVALLSDTGTGSGTATSVGAAVTGSSSAFNTQVSVGDTLTSASGGTCTVTVVGGATSITCGGTPSPAFAGTYTITHSSSAFSPPYIASLPTDPAGGTPCQTGCATLGDLAIGATDSGYYIARTTGNRIEVGSCKPEQAVAISVKR